MPPCQEWPFVYRACLLGLGAGIKLSAEGGEGSGGGSVPSTRDGVGSGCHRCSAAELGMTLCKPNFNKRKNHFYLCVAMCTCMYSCVTS